MDKKQQSQVEGSNSSPHCQEKEVVSNQNVSTKSKFKEMMGRVRKESLMFYMMWPVDPGLRVETDFTLDQDDCIRITATAVDENEKPEGKPLSKNQQRFMKGYVDFMISQLDGKWEVLVCLQSRSGDFRLLSIITKVTET